MRSAAATPADYRKSCVRFRRVADVDLAVIEELVPRAAAIGGMGSAAH